MIDLRVPLLALFTVVGVNAFAQVPEVSGAWVRAMPPGQHMTAAYLQLRNLTAGTVSITGVHSDVGMASLHETRLEGGRSSMRAVDSLDLAAGEAISMEPGGLHIMLMGLETTPVEGDIVPVCLQTSEGEVCADAQVQRAAPDTQGSHDHH
ncbi:copper chaperone PCu(A)C [Congregibacter variabilis]|uniref:Copper chaperone PCu(A)C n=1 Tax=Congregibacter variabilis TaxID=3081200 RepID=A0ABZ0I1U7_9GAMM|nr:copper chaperone PCu(A)C [Congregibacter sp. IMCC43200]